jgi:hypothetical protein
MDATRRGLWDIPIELYPTHPRAQESEILPPAPILTCLQLQLPFAPSTLVAFHGVPSDDYDGTAMRHDSTQ